MGDVDDDGFVPEEKSVFRSDTWRRRNVLGREEVDFVDNDIIFDQELAVFLVGTAAVVVPSRSDSVDMERAGDGLLDGVWDGHIIFDSVNGYLD